MSKSLTCFAHSHMTPDQYGLWTHLREVSARYKKLYFDGRTVANRFSKTSKSTVYRISDSLIRDGWLVVVKPSKRLPDGTYSKRELRVLSHKEWSENNPGKCQPVPPVGQDQTNQSHFDDHLSQNNDHLSQNEGSPVPPVGHKQDVTSIQEANNKQEASLQEAPQSGRLVPDVVLEGRADAPAANIRGATSPVFGTGDVSVSDTFVEDAASRAGLSHPESKAILRRAIEKLVEDGKSLPLIYDKLVTYKRSRQKQGFPFDVNMFVGYFDDIPAELPKRKSVLGELAESLAT